MVFNYVITVENIPKSLAVLMQGYQLSPFTFLLLANVIMLAVFSIVLAADIAPALARKVRGVRERGTSLGQLAVHAHPSAIGAKSTAERLID